MADDRHRMTRANEISQRGLRAAHTLLRLLPALAAILIGCSLAPSGASAATGYRTVHYRGLRLSLPATWPVFRLAGDSRVCVRFNRHALYLGTPSRRQVCPAQAAGRTEAILIEPLHGAAHAADAALTGAIANLTDRAHGVAITATWNRNRQLVERVLGRRITEPLTARPVGAAPAGWAAATARAPGAEQASATALLAPLARAADAAQAANTYTGLGFDACSAPSLTALSAWSSSPYRAVGIYIGGTNMACSQPNLSPVWVYQVSHTGWHLIPTYVGLQAPGNSCGCAAINPSQPGAEGAAAAADAIIQMQALGLGPGNPVYDDMEAYTSGSSTPAVLAFLRAWTNTLHAAHYLSGVYGSSQSTITDLAARYGTTYAEPDDLWIADWNGSQTTSDPSVPSADWPSHQRLHQYAGGHNETHGGIKINVDSDYLDAATAAGGIAPVATPAPVLRVSAGADGSVSLYPSWTGVSTVVSWQLLGGLQPSALQPIGLVANTTAAPVLTTHSAFPYYAVAALGAGAQILGTSQPLPMPAHIVIYGHSAFAPRAGLGAVPVGCFTGNPCQVSLTLTAGRAVVATTTRQSVPPGGSGYAYFRLTPAGRAKLTAAPGARLSVTATARDSSGAHSRSAISLITYKANGLSARRSAVNASTVRLVSLTEFVGGGGVGGALAGCTGTAPCSVTTSISAGNVVIARTVPEAIGANELAYVFFKLTSQGRRLLAAARGNVLGVKIALTNQAAATQSGGTTAAGSGLAPTPVATATATAALVSVG
jgi:hypothetical protein